MRPGAARTSHDRARSVFRQVSVPSYPHTWSMPDPESTKSSDPEANTESSPPPIHAVTGPSPPASIRSALSVPWIVSGWSSSITHHSNDASRPAAEEPSVTAPVPRSMSAAGRSWCRV